MVTNVLMPKFGLTMTEGTIEEWKVKEGDSVKKGDILFSVATDKLTNDVEADAEGILLKVLVGEGGTAECKSVVAYIGEANDEIPGEEISEKLYRLETSVGRIYSQIQKKTEKLPELRKFQEYYLPTTLKLVETYREFDGQPIAGANIKKAKEEIEASLETIIQAFDKLFDSLFAEAAMDVSTDISVLQTLLAQEGLTEDAWKKATGGRVEYMDMSDFAMELEGMTAAAAAGVSDEEQKTESDIRLML